jgi:hypothetical protein
MNEKENSNENLILKFYYDIDKGMINNATTLYKKIKQEHPEIKL